MELCCGSLFDKLHKQKDEFTPYEAVRMTLDISCAMEYLHAQKPAIIHRDLKSLNVLLAYDGRYADGTNIVVILVFSHFWNFQFEYPTF